jgi:hypothetical protein
MKVQGYCITQAVVELKEELQTEYNEKAILILSW